MANCSEFRDNVFHFQGDRLPAAEHARLQGHLDGCEDCAAYLAFEGRFTSVLQRRLRRATAPPELKARLREALAAEAPSRGRGGRREWLSRLWMPGTAATLASLVLAAVLIGPSLGAGNGNRLPDLLPSGPSVPTVTVGTLVDLQCDQAGMRVGDQRRCGDPTHVNALRIADGAYYHFTSAQTLGQQLMFARERRGERLEVEGELFPDLQVISLTAVRPAGRMAL